MESNYKYLGIIPRPLDADQSDVCFTVKNAVIAAGAGSGKTQVLATRFAWLVISKGIKADEILTLTFTNKAASEMYQRIYSTLQYFAFYEKKTDEELLSFFDKYRGIKNPNEEQIKEFREAERDLSQDKKNRAIQALNDFANSHIQTLDSYCGSIVRQCANRYGIRPDFSVGSSQGGSQIKKMALKFLLKHADSQAVKTYVKPGDLQHFADNDFTSCIIKNTSIASSRDFFCSNLRRQLNIIIKEWNYIVCGVKEALIEEDENFKSKIAYSTIADVYADIQYEYELAKTKQDQPYCLLIKKALDFYDSYTQEQFTLNSLKVDSYKEKTLAELIDILKEISSKASVIKRGLDYFNFSQSTKGYTPSLRACVKPFAQKSEIRAFYNSILDYFIEIQSIYSINVLFDMFLKEVNDTKRETGALSFKDVTDLALKVLLENEDIRNQEKNAFKKIMIDEFQDNNGQNRDLLYLLSLKKGEFESLDSKENFIIKVDELEPNSIHNQIVIRDKNQNIICDKRDPEKLFFVGDEKQSIYKFRGADVSVFNQLTSNEEEKSENIKKQMSFNYRSSPELINAFNILFKDGNGIFDDSSSKKEYEAYYEADAKKMGLDELPGIYSENVPIHIALSLEEATTFKDDSDNVQSETKKYIPLKEQNAYFIAKKIYSLAEAEDFNWSKFAILDKSRSDRAILTRYLSLFNIPFKIDSYNNIFEDALINDFYNFLRLCVYPSDINAFSVFLRSPFCGVNQVTLESVLCLTEGNILNKDFDEAIKKNVLEAEYVKFLKGRAFFEENRVEVLKKRLTETLSVLWNERGYKYETMLTNQALLCNEHFDMLFELARGAEEDGKSVSWFIDELAKLKSAFSSSDADINAQDIEYPIEKGQSVQIMTIHKSKGLQFDHVFVYGCLNVSSKSEDKKIYFDRDYGMSVKSSGGQNYFYLKQKEYHSNMEVAEFRRLVYVAITRAVKDVYIVGSIKNKRNGSTKMRLFESMLEQNYSDYDSLDVYGKSAFYNEGSAFDFESIPLVEYKDIERSNLSVDKIRKEVFDNFINIEEKSLQIKSGGGIIRKSPSNLELDGAECFNKNESSAAIQSFIKDDLQDNYTGLTELIERYKTSDTPIEEMDDDDLDENKSEYEGENLPLAEFTYSDFGSLIHDYLQKLVLGINIEKYEAPQKYLKNLKDSDKEYVKKVCVDMCKSFMQTDLWKELEECKKQNRFYRTEYEFKMYDEDVLYRGSMDLVFETGDNMYIIVDYKTDKLIQPQVHYAQQLCYAQALKELVPNPCRIKLVLYYIRYKRSIDITDNISR